MLCLKKVYTEELIQLAILLSILRADYNTDLVPEIPVIGIGDGDSWDFGRSLIRRDTSVHPKNPDAMILRDQELFAELHNLGRYSSRVVGSSLWQDVTAYVGLTNPLPTTSATTALPIDLGDPDPNGHQWDTPVHLKDDALSPERFIRVMAQKLTSPHSAYSLPPAFKRPNAATNQLSRLLPVLSSDDYEVVDGFKVDSFPISGRPIYAVEYDAIIDDNHSQQLAIIQIIDFPNRFLFAYDFSPLRKFDGNFRTYPSHVVGRFDYRFHSRNTRRSGMGPHKERLGWGARRPQ
ncbi:unnamed protein product [Nesidiocoris tenuis]|uniref:Uncharacterized protein n=1 Tax=Nesidiocoris tenuis TaxID=355587 RepID=A0A6H5H041_9HEMI|nr:unnamed protein product [Nesidiocoris tenuis]